MKVALVHDWLTGLRGGERVLEQLCLLYPDAEIFTLVHVPGSCGEIIESHPIRTSFLDRLPKRAYRHYLPLFPAAIGRADVLTSIAARALAPALRRWDVRSTRRVQGLIANSRFVAGRIRRFWAREVDAVVYPPVDTGRFVPAAEGPAPEGYALIVSALVPYKRVELAVSAFSRLKRPLWIAGDGPARARLERAAGPSVRFLGAVEQDALPKLYAGARFFVLPGEEDFGIAPVEAQAAGRPVLALGRGGALETVVDGETGVFFPLPTVASLLEGIEKIDGLAADPLRIHQHAAQFDVARFGPEVRQAIERCLTSARR